MFEILKDEICEIDISISQLAMRLGMESETLRDKLDGVEEFTWSEILKIRELVAPGEELEYLFTK